MPDFLSNPYGTPEELEEMRRRRAMWNQLQTGMQPRFASWGPNRQRMFMQGQTPNSPFMQQGNPINPFQQIAPVLQRPGAVNESGRFGASPGMGQMPTPQPSNPYSPTGFVNESGHPRPSSPLAGQGYNAIMQRNPINPFSGPTSQNTITRPGQGWSY